MVKKIVILGGGFGGVYTAMHLQKYLKKTNEPFEISLINRENYFVFQPMLAEVVGGSLGILDTINPIKKLLKKTELYVRDIEAIDIENKKVILTPKFTHTAKEVPFDHLVLSLGTVTDFRGMAGLHEHAFPFKNLADSIAIRNQVIDVLETAARTPDAALKNKLLTFVVGGGGFSGTEVVAEVNDLVHKLAKDYPEIDKNQIKVILVHSKDRLMDREMPESLGRYAEKLLKKRGVEFRFNCHLKSATPEEAVLDTGEHIPTKTVISTVPSSPNPLIESLPLKLERGKIVTDAGMLADGQDHIWAIGDCAAIPNLAGKGVCPPTAQFAIREAKVLAHNIAASLSGWKKKEFRFKALGMMGALGHHSAVAELFGMFKFSGLLAWFMWRAIYWVKLPGFTRKLKVALTWMLDTMIPIEAVQIKAAQSQSIAQLHFETDEVIFHEGDVGDYLYIIVSGEVEIYQEHEGKRKVFGTLSKGEYFGEMALLNQRSRTASVRCLSPVDVLALKKSDFGILISNFAQLKKDFEETEKTRRRQFG
ncbi:MAG: FAD-dependent oxidoreductase [Chlamydiia bacterium]|nr:FAD-dependent oxidoreductase [Chlamydiia bacterium]